MGGNEMETNHFEILNSINVNDKTEKKNGLTYLSWAWALAEVLKVCPDMTFEVKKFDGLPYVYDEKTGYMVYTEVTVGGITREMWLPVMDGANKAMLAEPYTYKDRYGKEKTVDAASMFDINKTVMRCLTKNLAMFGLGLYIYAGEDLPEEVKTPEQIAADEDEKRTAAEKIPQVSIDALNLLMARKGVKIDLKRYKLAKIEDMTKGTYMDVIADLEKMPDKKVTA
jgi:hypothetical protein